MALSFDNDFFFCHDDGALARLAVIPRQSISGVKPTQRWKTPASKSVTICETIDHKDNGNH